MRLREESSAARHHLLSVTVLYGWKKGGVLHCEIGDFAPYEAAGGIGLESGDDSVYDAVHLGREVFVSGEQPSWVAMGMWDEMQGDEIGGCG